DFHVTGVQTCALPIWLGLDVSYYDNYINNQILSLTMAPSQGAITQLSNIGRIANNGLEVSLSGTMIQRENFNWNARLNYSFNNTMVEKLNQEGTELTFYSADENSLKVVAEEGKRLGNIYVYDIA